MEEAPTNRNVLCDASAHNIKKATKSFKMSTV